MNPLATVVDEVTGSIQGAPAVFYMLQGAGGRLAVVYAESRESANELCRQLEALDASRGSWRHAAPMVKRSVLWPVWLRQAEEVRQLGERLRGGAPLLRFMEEALVKLYQRHTQAELLQMQADIGARDKAEIYLPWPGFNGSTSTLHTLPTAAQAAELAATVHPRWSSLKPAVQKLHARNCFQVLGAMLDCPQRAAAVIDCRGIAHALSIGTSLARRSMASGRARLITGMPWRAASTMAVPVPPVFALLSCSVCAPSVVQQTTNLAHYRAHMSSQEGTLVVTS